MQPTLRTVYHLSDISISAYVCHVLLDGRLVQQLKARHLLLVLDCLYTRLRMLHLGSSFYRMGKGQANLVRSFCNIEPDSFRSWASARRGDDVQQ